MEKLRSGIIPPITEQCPAFYTKRCIFMTFGIFINIWMSSLN
jgi:hypothetical protein